MPCLVALMVALCACESSQSLIIEANRRDFEKAGPITPMLDLSKVKVAVRRTGEYRVVPGDVVELYMPEILGTIREELLISETRQGFHLSRIEPDGKMVAPLVGRIDVSGKTVEEIEYKLKSMYHPKFVKIVPSIVGTVTVFRTHPVKIIGAVEKPGVYSLRHDEMSLISLLAKAGGIRTVVD